MNILSFTTQPLGTGALASPEEGGNQRVADESRRPGRPTQGGTALPPFYLLKVHKDLSN